MNDSREFEERLALSRRATPVPALPSDWQAKVMLDVRAQVPPVVSPTQFESAVRQAAIAASILALVVGVAAVLARVGATNELYLLVQSAPESLLELALVF